MTSYRAIVDLSVAKAGEIFEADDEQVAPALAFGLCEAVESSETARAEEQPAPKRTSTRARKSD
jgi:hypothetical protein